MVFEDIKKRLEEIGNLMNLSEKEKNILLTHKRIKKEILEVSGEKYEAWRIVHNDALGPGKGGIRYHWNVSEDEIMALSFWMSLKNSLMGLPFGGAKGGIRFNPKEKSKEELEKISREYIKNFHNVLGQDIDVPAPDVYTNPEIMGWMLDEFEKIKGKKEPGMITGKPISLGGIKLREDATAKGGFIVINKLLEKLRKEDEIDKENSKINVIIQGFGNAGLNIAKMLYDNKCKIIAVSDSKGGILSLNPNNEGLDINKLIEIKEKNNTFLNFSDGKKITNKELLELEADILVLAALENQITEENADNIKAKYIVEIANGPVNYNADKILQKKNITVIPDILANAGGVSASYLEWANNKAGNVFEEKYLSEKLDKIMEDSFGKVYYLWKNHNDSGKTITMREAAYILAIGRILEAEKARQVI